MIGIGIITYNRIDYLKKVVDAVIRNTSSPYVLVVADDGSDDGSKEFLNSKSIPMIGGVNRGISWNKNRALFALRNYAGSSTIVLLEDDTLPFQFGWEALWADAVSRFGYATYAHPKVLDAVMAGSGAPTDPYGCTKITSQCATVSSLALDQVGYFDTRFKGYGIEDGEWSTRLRNCGFGIVRVPDNNGGYIKANAMISGGVYTIDADSYRNNDDVARNREVFKLIRNDPIPRDAWRTNEEKELLIKEIEEAIRANPLYIRCLGANNEFIGP